MIGFVDWQEDTPERWGRRAMWGLNDEWRHYRYATHLLIDPTKVPSLLMAFIAFYGSFDPDQWKFHIAPRPDRDFYEAFIYTNDLDWRALDRLHGDILPRCTYYIFGNSQMGIEPIPYVRPDDLLEILDDGVGC